jgi:hypothetical protein
MKVYLPIFNTVVSGATLGDLEEKFVDHQQALHKALLLHTYTDGGPQFKNAKDRLFGVPEDIRNSAIDHAKKIVDIFDLRNLDYIEKRRYIMSWFGDAVFLNGREYVFLSAKWYERTWKKSVIKAPLKKQGLIFLKDWTSKHPTAGLTILTDKKNLRTLTYGMAVEKQTKQIIHAANMHLKNVRADKTPDIATADKRGEHFNIIEDQLIRDRGLKVNEAVKEIVKEARMLLFCGPVTTPDARYYERNGLNEIHERLELMAFQTRYEKQPVEMLNCDARLLRTLYDDSDKGHNAIAKGLADILDGYSKAKKL